MQFLQIASDTKLAQLSQRVGSRNVESILAVNSLTRVFNIGEALSKNASDIVRTYNDVEWQKKSSILNTFTGDSDIFEYAALLGDDGWKVLANSGTFPSMLRIPDSIHLTDSTDILGNKSPIPKRVYGRAMAGLSGPTHTIDPSCFNEYSSLRVPSIIASPRDGIKRGEAYADFKMPIGDIVLVSSLSGDAVEIPVYPETVEDGVQANYTQMPDLLYQYEPWQVYQSSGPRTNSYAFHMHRDMWTGNHNDGRCNDLIRFCESQCYAKYRGASVNTPIVTLYIKGKPLIRGIMTSTRVEWAGPLGHDGWYLECTLTLTITEVSESALSYDTVRVKPLIG